MKKAALCLSILFCLLSGVNAQEINGSSKVSEVTVYRSLAKETRTSMVTIPKGNSDVILSGVSMLMVDNSLQVSVKGEATLLSVGARTNYFTEKSTVDADIKAEKMRDTIQVIDLDLRWIAEQKVVHSGEMALVNEMLKSVQAKDTFKPGDIVGLADMHRTRILDLRKKIFDLTLKEEKLNARKARTQGQLNEMGTKPATPVKEIVLRFSSEAGATLQLRCAYLVNSASWTPMYDINVENTTLPVEMTYKARIRQQTGLEWKDVLLTVSTSNPSMDNNRPLMSPKYMDYVVYRTLNYDTNSGISNMMQVEKMDDVKFIASDPAVMTTESDIHVEYKIENRQSIPSDGKDYVNKLQNYTVPATYKYHTVPKLDPGAFLLARVTDYGQYNLLAGAASVFFGDTYVGQVQINPQITADTLLLSLGRDERIVVKRTRINLKTSKTFLTGVEKETYTYEITARNNKSSAIDIEVLDQVPLTRRKEIEVELLEYTGAEYDPTYGKLLWNFKLGANESKKIRFSYTVKYPQGKQVCEQ